MNQGAKNGLGIFTSEFGAFHPRGQPIEVLGLFLVGYLYVFGGEVPDKAEVGEGGVERLSFGMFPGPAEQLCD